MALTITKRRDPGNTNPQYVVADATFDNNYVTGGLALQPSDLGLRDIYYLEAKQMGVGSRLVEYDYATPTGHLKLYTALGTEAANASDQSAITVRVYALGTK